MLTPALPRALTANPFQTNWIISRRDDLTWFIGPALISYVALGLMAAGLPITLIYLVWFIGVDGPHVIAVCWQHYHIAKQHFGFIMLWKAKNKELDAADLKLDRWFLLTSTILPLALFVVKTHLANSQFVQWIGSAAVAVYLAFTGVYVLRQVKKCWAGLRFRSSCSSAVWFRCSGWHFWTLLLWGPTES